MKNDLKREYTAISKRLLNSNVSNNERQEILKRLVTDKNKLKNIREAAQITANKLFRMSEHKEQISSFFYKVNIYNKK